MRDPRLAELECLTTLERDGSLQLQVEKGGPFTRFGLDADPLREMLAELISEGCINGHAVWMANQDLTIHFNDLERLGPMNELNDLRLGGSVRLRIAHRGRLRLWRLRDELQSDRHLEQFGILLDRRSWERALNVQLIFASESEPLSILSLDVDHFKKVNDEGGGHPAGDEVLKRFFVIVRDIAGDDGDSYRIGGDEVSVLLPKADLASATAVAERIRAAVEKEFMSREKVQPTTSIGVSTFTRLVDAEAAKKAVDVNLYAAKTAGKNRVHATEFDR